MATTQHGQKTATADSQKRTSFLDLPTEIRIQIYRHLLPNLSVISVQSLDNRRTRRILLSILDQDNFCCTHSLRTDHEQAETSIMRVNRQIYTESSSDLYQNCGLEIQVTGYSIRHLAPDNTAGTFTDMLEFDLWDGSNCSRMYQHTSRLIAMIQRFSYIHVTLHDPGVWIPESLPVTLEGLFSNKQGSTARKYAFKDNINLLADILLRNWSGKRLDICFLEGSLCHHIESCVPTHLRPFSNIRGLDKVSIQVVKSRCGHLDRPDCHEEGCENHYVEQEWDPWHEEQMRAIKAIDHCTSKAMQDMQSTRDELEPRPCLESWKELVIWANDNSITSWFPGVAGERAALTECLHRAWTAYDAGQAQELHQEILRLGDFQIRSESHRLAPGRLKARKTGFTRVIRKAYSSGKGVGLKLMQF